MIKLEHDFEYDDFEIDGKKYYVTGFVYYHVEEDGITSNMGDASVTQKLLKITVPDFTIDYMEELATEEEIVDPSIEMFEAIKHQLESEEIELP